MYKNHYRLICVLARMALILCATLVPMQNVQAEIINYYVGGTGASDSNQGTASQPFATIQKAGDIAVAGDIINIRTGIYRETVTPANSGLPGNPIIYQPDGDAVVTISGADVANGGWSAYSGNIYKKTITMQNGYNANMSDNTTLMANQVFVDGKMMIEARWPNISNSEDLFNRNDFRLASKATWSSAGTQTITDPEIPNISGGWAGGTIWVNGWYVSQTRSIMAHTGTQISVSGNIIADNKSDFYLLTGKLGALDVGDEFFYDGAQLYLWQLGGGSPTNVEVKKRNYAFDLNNKSYITIRKINLFAATIISESNSKNIILDELNAKYINHAVTLTDPDIVYSHTGQTSTTAGATGIRLMGANSIIQNSEVSFGSGMGIILGENCTANNNLVHDIDYEGSYCSAIAPANGSNGQKIANNTIYRTGRSCVDILNSQNVEIGYNHMYDFGLLNNDLGATYSARNSNTTGLHIHHNWIHDNKAIDGVGINTGIYFDQNAGYSQIDHNVMWNDNPGAKVGDMYVQHTTYNGIVREHQHKIYNNTFASQSVTYSYKNSNNSMPGVLDEMKNNIFRDEFHITYVPHTPEGTNSLYLTQDPLFIKTGENGLKYRLSASSSLAINKGAVIPGVTDGYVGSAPDIGAYELGGEEWVPGYKAVRPTPTSIIKREIAPRLNVYPNPVSGELYIQTDPVFNNGYTLELFSANGKLVKTECVDAGVKLHRFDVSAILRGAYVVRLSSASRRYAKKVIIKT